MKIVNSYHQDNTIDREYKGRRYQSMMCPITSSVYEFIIGQLGSKNTFLFSGSWKWNLDATYLEPKFFQDCDIDWHQNTLFVDHSEPQKLLMYALEKINPDRLFIIHSDFFSQHIHLPSLINAVCRYKHCLGENGKIIFSIPLKYLNFNRLKMSFDDVVSSTGGLIIDDSFILVK